jgi:flagellar biosynthesis/type III secretory pathway protein FliH
VETSEGIVDASIDTQLKNLKEMVLSKNAIWW